MAVVAVAPETPPRKGAVKPRRDVDLSGLWEAWEENRAIRKLSRKKGSLLEWEDPSKVGKINKRSLVLNHKVILALVEVYCPSNEPNKTVPVQSLKEQVRKYFEEIDITPKPGMIYCTSHSLKMFMSYINRRNDGSKRKDHRLKAIFDAVGKHWQPKIRSRRTLALQDEEEPAEEEAEEEEEEALTEAEEEDGQPCEVDAYLAESMGLVTGSPQPASAYVGTVAYELDAETEQVVPYQAQVPAESIDLVRELAELEQRIAHRRAALFGQRTIEAWNRVKHMDTQQTIAADEDEGDVLNDELIQELQAFEAGETHFVRRGAYSNFDLALLEQEGHCSKDGASRPAPVATPARAAAALPAVAPTGQVSQEPHEVSAVAPTDKVSQEPHEVPAVAPTEKVSEEPSEILAVAPANEVSEEPYQVPAVAPTDEVSEEPCQAPAVAPADEVFQEPCEAPAVAPANKVSQEPGEAPAVAPADEVSDDPEAELCRESVSLEVASGSDAESLDLLACKVATSRELQMQDRAIKAKAPVEEDWEKEPKKRGWPKGKAKSKPKATAKAKAKAKAVAKPGKAKAKAKGKAKAVAKPAEDEPGESDPTAKAKAVAKPSEGEPGKSDPKAKARAKAKAKAVAKPSEDEPGKSDPKAKAKAKGKAKAVAKPPGGEPGESDPKAKAVAKPSDDEPGKSDPKPKGRAKGKAKAVAKPSLGEPGKSDPKAKAKGKARQMPCGDEKPSKRCKTDPKEDQPTSVSFARRNPQKGDSLCLWTAIRDSFYEVVRPFVKYPSKYEDPFWKHCKPKLLELDKTDDYLQVAKQEAAVFLKKLG